MKTHLPHFHRVRGDRAPVQISRPRSAVLKAASGYSAAMGTITLSAGLVVAGWSPMVGLSWIPGGVFMFVLAVGGLIIGLALLRDAWRLRGLANRESIYEWAAEQRRTVAEMKSKISQTK